MLLPDPALFTFALVNTGVLLFLWVYYVITISDLECDYLNAQQCCSKLNFWVKPKLYAHTILTILLLLNNHWILVLANLPMTGWMIYEITRVPGGNIGIYEPTEIYNHGQIKKYMRDCMVHLGYYLILFFTYLYCMIVALLKESPIEREDVQEEF